MTPGRPTPVLTATGINCRFGDRVILHDVALSLDAGQALALLGPHGSGNPP